MFVGDNRVVSRMKFRILLLAFFSLCLPGCLGAGRTITSIGHFPEAPRTAVLPGAGLKVSADGRFLVRNDGSPFFWLGDSAQTLLYRLSREDTDWYLEQRARMGFTVIQTQLVSFLGIDARNYYGATAFRQGDPRLPNEAFWEHVDYVVQRAASLGLTMALVADRGLTVDNSSYNNGIWRAGRLTPGSASSYGRFLGARYAGLPIVWVLGWDVHPSGREAVYTALANSIAEGAANGDHRNVLITFHPSAPSVGMWNIGSSSHWFHTQEWLDFNSIQSGHTDNNESYGLPENHTLIEKDYGLRPAKPTLDFEPAYEGTHDGFWEEKRGKRMGADVMRRKAYWALFAGAFGHTYGHNDVVAFHERGRPDYSGQNNPWKDVIYSEGAIHMAHVRKLMQSRPLLGRVPDQSILASPAGTGLTHIRATRAADGVYAFVYIPDGRTVLVNMDKISGSGVQASWFNPRSGDFMTVGTFANSGLQKFDTPGATELGNDWVLVLDSCAHC